MGQAKAVVDRYWDAFESGDFDRLAQLMTDTTELVMPGGTSVSGADQIVGFLQAYRAAFPDLQHNVINAIEDRDQVALELRISGIQTGTFRTPMGDVPPTGKSLNLDSCDVIKVAGGKITSWHVYFDQISFLSQLGLMPAPATA